jgi:hypothetical protein
MAEIFGVATGGMSVASLAIQIVDTIERLHKFWRAIKDAPKNIIDTLDELEVLGGMLMHLHSHLKEDELSNPSDVAARRSLDYCRRVARELGVIACDLQQGMNGSNARRRWTVVKYVGKKSALDELQARLERAKSMLSLAIECFSL